MVWGCLYGFAAWLVETIQFSIVRGFRHFIIVSSILCAVCPWTLLGTPYSERSI